MGRRIDQLAERKGKEGWGGELEICGGGGLMENG